MSPHLDPNELGILFKIPGKEKEDCDYPDLMTSHWSLRYRACPFAITAGVFNSFFFIILISIGLLPRAGVPNPWARDRYWSVACQDPGCTAGGEQRASEQNFTCLHYCLSSTSCLPPPPILVCGKVVFHETGPRRQKGWGPLA